jgi:hypothetical protein
MPLHRLRLQSYHPPLLAHDCLTRLCLITLRSTLDPILQRRAMRQGAASCRAVPRSCPVTAAAGVVTAEPSWIAQRRRRCNPSEVRAAQPAVAVVVVVQDVRTPATTVVPGSASGRRLVSRRRCPRDRVIRGVRTDTRPVSTAAAAALSGPCWIPESVGAAGPATSAHRVGRVAVVDARLGRRCPNRAWREGMVERWPCVARMRGAPSPPQVRPGQVAGVLADHGAGPGGGDHAAWSVRWCWSPIVPRWRPYPAQRGVGCGRAAAAVCQERCPLGTDSALTSENCGGRDRV